MTRARGLFQRAVTPLAGVAVGATTDVSGVTLSHGENRLRSRLLPLCALMLSGAAAAFTLLGCRMSNVGANDRDYPKVNPHPQRAVELRVSVPATLRVRFDANYSTPPYTGDCHFTVGVGAEAPFAVSMPVELHGAGEQQSAIVTIDRYLPGRCGWYFTGISYTMLDEPKLPREMNDAFSGAVAILT
jgi:hypothetical protein